VIDLHTHILPGMDDGAADLEASIAMSMTAVDEGIATLVATPHVNRDHPADPEAMGYAVGALNVGLARMEIGLAVLPGGELAMSTARELDDDTLRAFCLGGGPCLLLESPYGGELPGLEEMIADLQARGFRPMLAHPERSPLFQEHAERLVRLVERGVHCTVNAGSMTGRSGDAARDFTLELFRRRLVHSVGSDAHDNVRRPPRIRAAFESVEAELAGIGAEIAYFTHDAPAAILAGGEVPEPPVLPKQTKGRFRRLFGKTGSASGH
jgi:protein-tyrosine phosphatase